MKLHGKNCLEKITQTKVIEIVRQNFFDVTDFMKAYEIAFFENLFDKIYVITLIRFEIFLTPL